MIFRKLGRSIAFKSISGIVFLLVLFTGMISRVGYRGFADEIFRQYTDEAFRIADAAAKDVDADLMEDFVSSRGATADYQEAWDALEARELIKCSVQREAPLSAREACQELCEKVHAAPVQCIGGKFSIYRPRRKDPTIELP